MPYDTNGFLRVSRSRNPENITCFFSSGIIILKSGLSDKEEKLNEFALTKGELASNILDNAVCTDDGTISDGKERTMIGCFTYT